MDNRFIFGCNNSGDAIGTDTGVDSWEINVLIEHQNRGWIFDTKIYSLFHHLVIVMIVDVVQYGTIPGINVTWLHVDRTKTYFKKRIVLLNLILPIFSMRWTKLKCMILFKLEAEIESVEWEETFEILTSLAFSLQLADVPQSIEASYYTVVL